MKTKRFILFNTKKDQRRGRRRIYMQTVQHARNNSMAEQNLMAEGGTTRGGIKIRTQKFGP